MAPAVPAASGGLEAHPATGGQVVRLTSLWAPMAALEDQEGLAGEVACPEALVVPAALQTPRALVALAELPVREDPEI